MFPTDINLKNTIQTAESEQAEISSRIGRSFLFNFETGQHEIIDGAVAECDELTAIKQWLRLMVNTAIDKYQVYKDTGFGTSAEKFIGRRTLPQGFVASELEREIKESCLLCPAIDRAGDFKITRTIRGMQIAFTVYLVNSDVLEVSEIV